MDNGNRVILDTNLWISYLISSRLVKIDLLLQRRKIRLIFSEESMLEFIKVARRPKFRKYFSEEDINRLLELFDYFGDFVQVHSKVDICRDPKDNFLLALAKDSKADYLITGDSDLLTLGQFETTKIVTFSAFEATVG
ncbi:MAG TPA: putative toxin-antitoxin system toxin component, PIN family [Saprospiraceae bacterium]|nr:putative toxin-antitoxin system toxin component, PIN family [Saprospiraceae bacterium]HMP25596.1 putative toxin-antitoxin system toxin component, PIN family [Saprospiraceae bacterium]